MEAFSKILVGFDGSARSVEAGGGTSGASSRSRRAIERNTLSVATSSGHDAASIVRTPTVEPRSTSSTRAARRS